MARSSLMHFRIWNAVRARFNRAILPLTFVRWFDPSEGRIFVVFLSNPFWQICCSAALRIVLILFDKFAVFGRSKNGVSSFSWYLRRTVNKEKTALTRAVIMFLWFFYDFFCQKKVAKKPVFCYDEIVEKSTQQRGAFRTPSEESQRGVLLWRLYQKP